MNSGQEVKTLSLEQLMEKCCAVDAMTGIYSFLLDIPVSDCIINGLFKMLSFKFICFVHCVINPNSFDWIAQEHSPCHSFPALKPIIQLLLMGHVLVLDLMCV